jgi:ParB family chromosome partitioning protein
MTMDIKVPLKMLKFGHEGGEHINARVVGRDDDIAGLAANIYANRSEVNPSGLIENLLVKNIDGGSYSVANGNRRLKALHMIDGPDSDLPIGCTLHDVDSKKAFEYSLTTAVTARQLHPVDQYEGFAYLRDEEGKTEDEIAHQYGMTEKEVRQALALGRLSPTIRDLWRKGDIKAEVAQAFTLAVDHKTQDKLYKKLTKENDLDRQSIRAELGVKRDDDIGALVNFVGITEYEGRGGKVTEDLFKGAHLVSDGVLLKAMVTERLQAECTRLVEQGWAWASVESDLPASWRNWPKTHVDVSKFFTPEESELAARLDKQIEDAENDWKAEEAIEVQIRELEQLVEPRGYTSKQMSKLGCMVEVDDEDGKLIIVRGISRPAAASKSSAAATPPTAGEVPIPAAKPKGGAIIEPDVSQALIHRLSVQLTIGAQTALIQDADLATSMLLATFATSGYCEGIKASVAGLGYAKLDLLGGKKFADNLELARALKPADRAALLVLVAGAALDFQAHTSSQDLIKGNAGLICNAIKPAAMNAALRGAFDAKDYFNSVPKSLCLIAIKEALGTDAARKQDKSPKGDIATFAIANVPATGWLPEQLRAKGYDGPPVSKAKAPVPAKSADRKKKPAGKAAAKKTAKKSTAKKRKAA